MSRFANERATGRLVLRGGCQCSGTPHDEDWIELRTELGTVDTIAISEGKSIDALERLIVDWNLHGDDGKVAPVDREHIGKLFADAFDELETWVEANVTVKNVPKASAAHSRNGSRASVTSSRGKTTGR